MNGYKIFDKNFCCRGLQYRVGETLKHEGPIEPCVSGLHFCERALDCTLYYPLTQENRYAEVRAVGRVIKKYDKSATDELEIVREIPYEEFRDRCTGTIHKYGDNNQMLCESTWKRGVMNGVFRIWFASGQLEMEYHYVDGKISGAYQHWYKTGQLYVEGKYTDGKFVCHRIYYDDGSIKL